MSQSPEPTQQPTPAPLNSQSVPLAKPQNKSREIDRIARQLEGLSKSVKRLKETP